MGAQLSVGCTVFTFAHCLCDKILSDDLDLYVRTPAKEEIYYGNPFDPVTNGTLDHDDIPFEPSRWIESIYFPLDGSAPKGEYKYWVENYNQIDDPDSWILQVYIGDSLVRRHLGLLSEDIEILEIYTFIVE